MHVSSPSKNAAQSGKGYGAVNGNRDPGGGASEHLRAAEAGGEGTDRMVSLAGTSLYPAQGHKENKLKNAN